MTIEDFKPIEGGCTCRHVRFRMIAPPMFVHCCHCRWCQRETGSAFVINALIEADGVELLSGKPEVIVTPSASGKGQNIHRCPICKVAVWSNYAGAGEAIHFLRAGTLDNPNRIPPDIHIYTSSKQPWVKLTDDVPVMPEFYRFNEHWPKKSHERYRAVTRR